MTRMFGIACAGLLAWEALAAPAIAGTVLDTGPAPICCYWTGVAGDGGPDHWVSSVAVQFSLSDWTSISSIQTYAYVAVTGSGLLTNRIYNASSGMPGTSSALYEATTGVAYTTSDSTVLIGATGLSWLLAPGTYWAAFETPAGSTLGAYPTSSYGVSPPYVWKNSFLTGGDWVNAYAPLNARIEGDPASAPVPEPAAWALMVGGFGFVGGLMRRRTASVSYA